MRKHREREGGFTLLELLVVIAILTVLMSLILPALARAKSRAHSLYCANNLRQLTLGCLLQATDQEDRLPYNLGPDEIKRYVAQERPPIMSQEPPLAGGKRYHPVARNKSMAHASY
jgi:prepilin-type N-terminal cleavage/methylation domain-containing protein